MYTLEKLFVISPKIAAVFNDTDQTQLYQKDKLLPGELLNFGLKDGHKLIGRKLLMSSGESEICVEPSDVLINLKDKLKAMPEAINFLDFHYQQIGWFRFSRKRGFLEFIKNYVIVFGCEAEKKSVDLKSYESVLNGWVKRKVINRIVSRGMATIAICFVVYNLIFPLLKYFNFELASGSSWFLTPFFTIMIYKFLDKDSVY
jgi:hypothetical protein